MFKSGLLFAHVITVCDEVSAERCPIFAGITKRFHWSFPDPSKVPGTHDEKLEQVREIRDLIRRRAEDWCEEAGVTESIPGRERGLGSLPS
jgi:arsenate reductase